MNFNKIKNYIKNKSKMVNYILQKKNILKSKNIIDFNIKDYEERFIKYSTSYENIEDSNVLRRKIIISSHIIEKGLSHTNFRAGFGKKIVVEIQNNLKKYKNFKEIDGFAYLNAISLLKEYHKKNVFYKFDDSSYLDIDYFNQIDTNNLSPYDYEKKDGNLLDSFKLLTKNRHSVRLYENEALEISNQEIQKVIEYANTAPSACNRQATHIFAYKKRENFQRIEELQIGCKGFGRNASLFLFVTSDLSLYTRNEVKLPIFDSGIYAMNLLYSLESFNLDACILNAHFVGEKAMEIHKLISIPDKYEINGVIAVYKLENNPKIKIAFSPRRSYNDTLTIVDK